MKERRELLKGLAVGSIHLWIGVESGHIDDGKLGHMFGQFRRVQFADKHVAGKEIVPGVLIDHPNGHAVTLVRAGVTIEDE